MRREGFNYCRLLCPFTCVGWSPLKRRTRKAKFKGSPYAEERQRTRLEEVGLAKFPPNSVQSQRFGVVSPKGWLRNAAKAASPHGSGGGDQRGESGRNALLLNGWCVSGSGSYQIFDEAVSSHLGCLSRATRTQVCCPQRPHTFPTATCPLLRSVVLATFCKIWTPRLI